MARYTEWILQYKEGRLSAKERKRFEDELKTNPDLYEEYMLNNLIDQVIKTDMEIEREIGEIMNDPDYEEADMVAKEMVDKFYRDASKDKPLNDQEKEALFESWYEKSFPGQDDQALTPLKRLERLKKPERMKPGAAGEDQSSGTQRTKGTRHRFRIQRHTWIALSVAASIAALLVVLNISLEVKPAKTDILLALYVEEVTSKELNAEEVSSNVYRDILKGVEQFESSDYDDAIATFASLERWKDEYPEISLFRGLVHLEIGENRLALSAFDECASHRGPYRKYARWFRNLAYVRLVHPKAAAMYIIERSNFFHKLPPGMQVLIHRVNLISTGRFEEYRQDVNPDASGPWIMEWDDIVAAIFILLFVFLVPLFLIIDILLHRYEKKMKLWLIVIVLMPIVGPITYLSVRKKIILKE